MAKSPTFIDLCAGCGGLSLGLMEAGWTGRFAVEKNQLAFETLQHNLLREGKHCFEWPEWLPAKAISLETLLSSYRENLRSLAKKVDLLAGGPPCQGFSTVGRRLAHDPRNQVFKNYIRLVDLLQPRSVLMENVRGILHPFKADHAGKGNREEPEIYAELIKKGLGELGYDVSYAIVHARDFGVPQTRPRFILIGLRREGRVTSPDINPFQLLHGLRLDFLNRKGLGADPISVRDALSDLTSANEREPCPETPRYQIGYYGKQSSAYQRLMHSDLGNAAADSHRFVNHRKETTDKFQWFHQNCSKGKKIEQADRGAFSNKKHTLYILHPSHPAPTVTTLPDDLLHYGEPRILTVREMARLQSFPDWFEFKGKYTTADWSGASMSRARMSGPGRSSRRFPRSCRSAAARLRDCSRKSS